MKKMIVRPILKTALLVAPLFALFVGPLQFLFLFNDISAKDFFREAFSAGSGPECLASYMAKPRVYTCLVYL